MPVLPSPIDFGEQAAHPLQMHLHPSLRSLIVLTIFHENQATHRSLGTRRDLAAAFQNELAELALELDASVNGNVYQATPDELAGIDRGLRGAADGRFASDAEIKAAFARFCGQ